MAAGDAVMNITTGSAQNVDVTYTPAAGVEWMITTFTGRSVGTAPDTYLNNMVQFNGTTGRIQDSLRHQYNGQLRIPVTNGRPIIVRNENASTADIGAYGWETK